MHDNYVQFPGDFNSTGKSQVVANKLTWTQAQLMYMGDHLKSELREKIQEREREGEGERERIIFNKQNNCQDVHAIIN